MTEHDPVYRRRGFELAEREQPQTPSGKIIQIACNQDRLMALDDAGNIYILNRGGNVWRKTLSPLADESAAAAMPPRLHGGMF